MNFKEQIKNWWNHRLSQLQGFKEAHKDGAMVRIASSDDSETMLTDEQSKKLLEILVQLSDVFLEIDFPDIEAEETDTKAAIAVHNWHADAWFDVLDKVDELMEEDPKSMAQGAKGVLNDILELPFSLHQE